MLVIIWELYQRELELASHMLLLLCFSFDSYMLSWVLVHYSWETARIRRGTPKLKVLMYIWFMVNEIYIPFFYINVCNDLYSCVSWCFEPTVLCERLLVVYVCLCLCVSLGSIAEERDLWIGAREFCIKPKTLHQLARRQGTRSNPIALKTAWVLLAWPYNWGLFVELV